MEMKEGAGTRQQTRLLSAECELDVVLESLELWMQEPIDVWRVGLEVKATPVEATGIAALEVQEWLLGFLPLVHYETFNHDEHALVVGYSAYPEETVNLAEEIRLGLEEFIGPAIKPVVAPPARPASGLVRRILNRLRRSKN